MVQNMITLLSVMIALLLVLIAINAVLRWLNPRNINGEEAAAFRAHRQNVFGFLALAVLFLGAYVGVSVLDNRGESSGGEIGTAHSTTAAFPWADRSFRTTQGRTPAASPPSCRG